MKWLVLALAVLGGCVSKRVYQEKIDQAEALRKDLNECAVTSAEYKKRMAELDAQYKALADLWSRARTWEATTDPTKK